MLHGDRMHDDHEPEGDLEAARPSKSERKRRSAELQDLGESLIDLPQSELDALELPDKLRDAVDLARRITKRGGLYRQKQYIGKLMRQFDTQPIRDALEARRAEQRRDATHFKRLEQWRDRLIAGEPGVLDALSQSWPDADLASLDRLAEQARRERAASRTPRAARELFAALRALAADAPPTDRVLR